MFRFLVSLCISWSISSWLLTETLFFFPSLESAFSVAGNWLTIPRHDEWDMTRVERERIALQNATLRHLPPRDNGDAASYYVTESSRKSELQLTFIEHPFTIRSVAFESFRSPSGGFWWS